MAHTLTIVSHTHWDREWYQPYQEYRIRLVQLVDRLLDLLDGDPTYLYFTLDGQAIILEDYLEIRPAGEWRLHKHIQEGRLLAGPWYVLPDEFLVSPEAIIRNLLLGAEVTRRFGAEMALGYVPDSFGHISQLPQIIRGFNMDAAVIWRGVGEAPNEFRWAAPDGSKVLVIHLRAGGYGNAAHLPTEPRAFAARLRQIADDLEPYAATPHLLAMNGGDHLEPMPQLPRLIAAANAQLSDLQVRQGTLPQYAAAIQARQPVLPLRRGELRSPERAHLLPGVFSTRMWIKQRNARCEALLEKWAEPFSAFADLQGLETPTRDLHDLIWQAWWYLIQNHAHDSICGCSIDLVHKEMDVRFDWAEQIGEEVTRQSLDTLAQAVDTTQFTGLPVVVYNPVAGPRSDLVKVQLFLPPDAKGIEVVDAGGRRVPSQIVRPASQVSEIMHLNREEFRQTWAETNQGTLGGEGIQAVEMSTTGDRALIEVTTAPYPPDADVLGRATAAMLALLERPAIQRFELRLQHRHRAEVHFVACDLPGFGYKSFAVHPVPAATARPRSGPGNRIENEFFDILVEPSTGTLTVTDKTTGMVLTGLNRFIDGGDRGDEYNYCPPENDRLVSTPAEIPSIRLLEDGPVRQTLEIAQIYQIPASLAPGRTERSGDLIALPLTTRVSLSPGVARIDLSTTVRNHCRDHRLRVLFPTPIRSAASYAEGHFDVLARSLDLPPNTRDWPEQPVTTHHQRAFVDVNDGHIGLLIANRGLPEYEVIPGEEGVTVALTLLRCIGWLSRDDLHCRRGHAGPGLPTPEAQCLGPHTFDYALVPHRGDWREAYAQAHAFNAPLRAVSTASSSGSLPAALSFVQSSPSDFVLTAVKRAQEGDGVIVRGFNIAAEARNVTLQLGLPWSSVAQVDLNEGNQRELVPAGKSVQFVALPKQIVTLRFD